jgi:hypothetical protein
MDAHQVVKVEFRGAQFNSQCKTLDDLSGFGTKHVQANDALALALDADLGEVI